MMRQSLKTCFTIVLAVLMLGACTTYERKVVPFKMFVYMPDEQRYEEISKVPEGARTASISGTQVRDEYLNNGRPLPEWFTRPEVAQVLAEAYPPRSRQGVCIWFTGLSGAGKSTVAEILAIHLLECGRQATILDGDVVRTHLSKGLGFSKEEAEYVRLGGALHDIGKIGIPEKILLKQGSLDPDEWDIMKQHTTIGAQILHGSKADFIRFAEIIAFTHHEKWDGTGYPQGLKGTDIPLIGRIVAVVDVFDALTTKRPYRDALTVEDSLNFIIERRGTHFDPNLVDAFLEIKEDILSIKAQYKETQESLLIQLTEKKYKSPLITNKAMSMFK
mgnify:CR=1 FL=1